MAVLPDADRTTVHAEVMRGLSEKRETVAVTKADLRSAINALDDFLSNNATALNNAIPQPARNNLTVSQKALLLMYVIDRRYGSGV